MTDHPIRLVLKSQYHASLAMLNDAVQKCPDDLWLDATHTNPCWQVAYHVVFYTHLYLHRDEASFVPWEHHQAEVQYPGALPGPPPKAPSLPRFPRPYSKAQVLEYLQICDAMVDGAVDGFDLDAPECGFWWYPMSKLEHQFVNIRHIQHHAAQLADRVRARADVGVGWVGGRPSA